MKNLSKMNCFSLERLVNWDLAINCTVSIDEQVVKVEVNNLFMECYKHVSVDE